MYRVVYKPTAEKEFESLENHIFQRLYDAVMSLEKNPYPHPQSRKLELSKSNMCRLRVGDYRIVYTVDDIQKVVRILYVRHPGHEEAPLTPSARAPFFLFLLFS
ncbi:plasmid stabilization system protein [Candidatus Magnetobacterium bavaricum]|uniref:Plasmid stabilization system protein n=1 Tax=Candidatus Magnetobacterium bavaricum TaxID=29290 RepID=A0A0F3GWZ8_9BACT|nr:plasmid stabilization system protein [Candidatus Magnetobacterium bavaricum]